MMGRHEVHSSGGQSIMMGRQGDRSRRPAAAQEIENEQGMGSSYKA